MSDGYMASAELAFSGVMKVTQTGTATIFASEFAQYPLFATTLPAGLALDASGIFYLGTNENTIQMISPSGALSLVAGMAGVAGSQNGVGALATFNYPNGLAVDMSGNIYVADTGNNKIRLIAPGGAVSDFAGTGVSGSSDAPVGSATFNSPWGIAVDSAGGVFVADAGDHTIRLIKGGMVTTVAGSGSPGFADGTGNAARFSSPGGIALDALGNLYVADTGNGAIRKVSASGVVTTIAGSPQRIGLVDGTADVASFSRPEAVAVDSSGAVYVSDEGNMAVRKLVYQ